jgi:Fic family protein
MNEQILEGLNKEQLEAVTHGEGPLLIIAGAGTGKTRVITNEMYQAINKVSRRTALSDLRGLVESGQVKTKGIGKGTKYSV